MSKVLFVYGRCDVTWTEEPYDDVCWNCDKRGRRPNDPPAQPRRAA